MSASWFSVSTYLIWIWGPNWLCQTTNLTQLCGFCIVGLLPFTIILNTASFFSKINDLCLWHVPVLSVMDVGYQTTWASVSSSCPFCDCSCKFVFWPENVRSTSSCQIQPFVYRKKKNNQRAYFWQLQPIPVLPSCRDDHPSKEQRTLYKCCLFASSHKFSSHFLAWPRDGFCARFLPPWQFFSCSSRPSWFEKNCQHSSTDSFVRFAFTLKTTQMRMVKKRCWFSKTDQFHLFLPHGETYSAFFQPSKNHPRSQIRMILVFDERTDVSNRVLSPVLVPIELPQTVFPTRGQQVGDRASFVREEALDLQCLTMTLAICVVDDVSTCQGILTLDVEAILEQQADAASDACPGQPGGLAMTSISSAAVICDADEPCSVDTA